MTSISEIISLDKIESKNEWIIIHHSIMIDEILSFVYTKHLQKQLLRRYFNEYDGIIYQWLIDYYTLYKKSPKLNIQNIFDSNRSKYDNEKIDILEKRLDKFAEDYRFTHDHQLNIEFIKKEIIPNFIISKKAEILKREIDLGLDKSDSKRIIAAVDDFRNFDFEDENEDFGVVIPSSKKEVDRFFNYRKERGLFSLPGVIGKTIGPFYRGATYAVTGTEKSGKTIFMSEISYQAVVFNKLKAFVFSLEIDTDDMEERIYCRAGHFTNDRLSVGRNLLPVIDCLNNQLGTCKAKKIKPNMKKLINSITDSVLFYQRPDWRICADCRSYKNIDFKNVPKEKRFIPAIWFKEKRIKFINKFRTEKAIRLLNNFNFRNYRIRSFPRFSANFEDIYNVYKNYCKKKNFKPDIVVIDYPDIMQPIDGKILDRHNIDFNWKKCAQFAQEENVALIIADQTNKIARNARSITSADTSEDKRKDAHIDLRITINRNDEETLLGLQRVGTLFKRKGKLISMEVMLFQNTSCYNPLLDSCFWPHTWLKYPIGKGQEE